MLYAFVHPDGFHLVANEDLGHLDIDRAALAMAAHDNLVDRMANLQLLERPDGCGMVQLDGNLESSTLLVPELWSGIAEILGDDLVVAVPGRDAVLFCGAANAPVRSALIAARDRALAVGNHQITKALFRFTACAGGSWTVEQP